MAIVNGYTDLVTIKAVIGLTNTDKDTRLEQIVQAVSRQIDQQCGRRFYAANQTRYYTPRNEYCLTLPDDLLSVTTLTTDDDGDGTVETVWASTDYLLTPFNASADGIPYSGLVVNDAQGRYCFPLYQRSVEIMGSFGYAETVPDEIREATIIQSVRIFRRGDAPFGVTGSAEMGQSVVIARLDPDVRAMLAHYRKTPVG